MTVGDRMKPVLRVFAAWAAPDKRPQANRKRRSTKAQFKIGIDEPLKAVAYFLTLLVGFVFLLVYVVAEIPGMSAASWRVMLTPNHPANGDVRTSAPGTVSDSDSSEVQQPHSFRASTLPQAQAGQPERATPERQ